MGGILGMIPAALGAAGQIAGAMGMGDKRQLRQQEKLNKQQIQGNKELADYQQKLQMDMWNKTNYGAQVDQLKAAGLNPALLYGKGGGGGATMGMASTGSVSGGQAANAAATTQAGTQGAQTLGMLPAQIELIKAQTENVKADTATKGVQPAQIKAATTGQEFTNEVNKLIGSQAMANKARNEAEKAAFELNLKDIESSRAGAEWESYLATGYKGKTYDDPEAPINKALKAGLEKVLVELEQAKVNKDIGQAERTLKEFEANLTKQGIAPNSPWYMKIMMDMADKLGYSPTKL